MRQELLELLVEKSFKYSKDAEFKLASGKQSNYYVDCKKVTLNSKGLLLVGTLVFEKIRALDIKGIGGLTLGADPIAMAASLIATQNLKEINPFVVRKQAKGHGTGAFIEGVLKPDDNVVVVDDVITTGGSTIKAINRARDAGFNVVKAVVLVDREEGGREAIEELGVPVDAVFLRTELFEHYKKTGGKVD
jgi:orotate phosphoribosyltransferase